MGSHYTSPECVTHVELLLSEGGVDKEDIVDELRTMTKRYDNLLHEFYRTIDNYSKLLEAHGPYHEVELGEPLSRFENILRKALNE